jgi:glycerophosphoryl diester phosphodiesterase
VGSDWAFLDHPGPLAFAHRGAHGPEGPGENTMAAFQAAVDLGYRYLETDVHLTADGVVVAFHDDHLDRVTDRTGAIADLTWAEVGQASVGADGSRVPRLDDVLSTWPDVKVNIDPKADDVVEPLAEALRAAGAVERVCCGSFSDDRLARLRDLLGPGLCTSLGPKATAKLAAAALGAPVRHLPAPCAQVPTHIGPKRLVTARFVRAAHALGLQVHVWTIDDEAEMAELLDMGVDGLMTDRAALLRGVLEGRGEWA